jgi:hypothetical protein
MQFIPGSARRPRWVAHAPSRAGEPALSKVEGGTLAQTNFSGGMERGDGLGAWETAAFAPASEFRFSMGGFYPFQLPQDGVSRVNSFLITATPLVILIIRKIPTTAGVAEGEWWLLVGRRAEPHHTASRSAISSSIQNAVPCMHH